MAARELIGSSEWFESLWRQRDCIEDIPALLLWGMQDEFVSLDGLEKWQQLFKHKRMIRLANAGHLVQEDAKATLGELIKEYLHDQAVVAK